MSHRRYGAAVGSSSVYTITAAAPKNDSTSPQSPVTSAASTERQTPQRSVEQVSDDIPHPPGADGGLLPVLGSEPPPKDDQGFVDLAQAFRGVDRW